MPDRPGTPVQPTAPCLLHPGLLHPGLLHPCFLHRCLLHRCLLHLGLGEKLLAMLCVVALITGAILSPHLSCPQAFAGADMLAHLPLDDGSGSQALDASGSGNHGTLLGGASFDANSGDGSPFSVRFDGVNDAIDLGSIDVIGTQLTLAAWIFAESFPGSQRDPRIISKATGTSTDQHVLMLSTIRAGSKTRLRARVRVGGAATTVVASTGDLSLGQWFHTAVTYDGTLLRLYLDGVEVGSEPLSGAVDVAPGVALVVGGQPAGAGDRFFHGNIDDVRILQRALTVAEVNALLPPSSQPPVATDDAYGTTEENVLFVDAASGVLTNDSDPELDPLSALLVSSPVNGSVNLSADGSFEYSPALNFSGTDSFTYRANDGSSSSPPATVTLTVTPLPDPPLASDDSYQTLPDSPLNVSAVSGVLANDTDPDADPLSATLVSPTSSGTVFLSADGSFIYSPAMGFLGTDSFTYLASDGSFDSNPATVTILVDGATGPDVIVRLPFDEGSGTIAEDIGGMGNDGTLVGGPVFEPAPMDGSPFGLRFDGIDDFVDLGAIDVDGSGITLAAWFRADAFPGSGRDPRMISKASGTSADDHVFMLSTVRVGSLTRLRARLRVNGDTKTLVAASGDLTTGQWYHAAMTYDGDMLRLFLDALEVGTMGLSGAVDQDPGVAVAIGGQPPGAGDRFFDGTLDDVRILQRALTAAEIAVISPIPGLNLPPDASDDSYGTSEEVTLTVSALTGVLTNDTDPELDPLTASLVTNTPNGNVTLLPDGSFQYVPDVDYSGTDSFTYRASDGNGTSPVATVEIDVAPVDDAPVANDDLYQTTTNATLTIDASNGVLSNDNDPDLDPLTALLVDDVSSGTLTLSGDGSFVYEPDLDFVGTDSFTYVGNDTTTDSNLATVEITVSAVPLVVALVHLLLDEGSGSVALDASGSGNDGALLGGPVYEPSTGDNSPFALRFDGSNDTVDLGPLDVNGSGLTLAAWFHADSFPGSGRDPRIISKATGTSADDHLFMLSTVRDGSTTKLRARVRVGGDTTTLVADSGNLVTGQWYHAALTYDGSQLRLFLDGVEVGNTALTGPIDRDPSVPCTVGGQPPGAGDRYFDGLLDDIRILEEALDPFAVSLIFNPNPGNLPPTSQSDDYSLVEDGSLSVDAAAGVLANDTDPQGDPITAQLVGAPSDGALTLMPDGSFDYTPDPDFSGSDAFTYRANDGFLSSGITTVTLAVAPQPDAPVAVADTIAVPPNATTSIQIASDLLENDFDADGDVLSLQSFTPPGIGSLTDNGTTLSYTPPGNFTGSTTFTYRNTDGAASSAPATVTLIVNPIVTNAPPRLQTGDPIFSKQVIDTTMDETHTVVVGDFDQDGDLDAAATDFVDDTLAWYENNGNYGYTRRVVDSSLDGSYPAFVADVDQDGDVDLLACGYLDSTVVWYENNGTASFTKRVVENTPLLGPHSVVAVDLDQDGDVDLLTSNQDHDSIFWYENDGSENFTTHVIDDDANGAKRAEPADMDGDGDIDVVIASFFDSTIAWLENDGSEGFTKRIIDDDADGGYYCCPLDAEGDGDMDVVTAAQEDNRVSVYRNNGSQSFTRVIINNNAVAARTAIAADVNDDGHDDILSASVDDDTVSLYLNDGNGTFTRQVVDGAADGAYGIGTGDMNKDGITDVLSASRDSYEIAIYYQSKVHEATLGVGGTLTINASRLLTTDIDDDPDGITYTVTDAPNRGTLRRGGSTVSNSGTFTQEDVNGGLVTYTHNGSGSTDEFEFEVVDGGEGGVNPASGVFELTFTGSPPPPPPPPPNDGPPELVELSLDEGSGTFAADGSGMGNHGTLMNGAAFSSDTGDGSNSSVLFGGGNDRIDLGNVTPNGSGLTLAVRFKADSYPGAASDPRMISKATGTSSNAHVFMLGMIASDGAVRLRGRVRVNGSTKTVIASTGDLPTGLWQHAALTYNGSTIRLYLNGVQVGSTGKTGSVDFAPTVPVAIGNQPAGAGDRGFDGRLDDVLIWQRAMTASEISDLAN